MAEVESSVQMKAIERRAGRIQLGIVGALVIIVLSIGVNWWWEQRQPVIANVSITDVSIVGPTSLCPGESLTTSYVVHISGAGVLERDGTTWKSEPPYTIINTSPQRIVIDGSIDQPVEEAWVVPTSYLNPLTGRTESLPAGSYRRSIALSSLGRNATSSIGSVDFSIRAECSGE